MKLDRRHFLFKKLDETVAQLQQRLDHTENSLAAAAYSLLLSLGDCPIHLQTDDVALYSRLSHYFRNYLIKGSRASFTLQNIFLSTFQDSTKGHSQGEFSTEIWEDSDAEFRVYPEGTLQRDFVARRRVLNFDAVGLLAPDNDDSFHNFLRWFLPEHLLGLNTFLLHGAGVVSQNKGYVFFGQSGAGKSTAVSLILNEDKNVIPVGDDTVLIKVNHDGLPILFSAPFGCGYSREAPPCLSVPIAGMYSLQQDTESFIEKIPFSQSVAALLASAMNMNAMNTSSMDSTFNLNGFDLAQRFSQSNKSGFSGVQRLHFNKTPEFWRLVQWKTLTSNSSLEKNMKSPKNEPKVLQQ